ncbi:membrane dipeptidase [Parahaliea mediterranea]|uniref:Membrane dipeptidase n=1 Tax=Parahaliea mediterranea TaxID=651086 RepID=A0A939IJC8_9GAMM|nr:membrane dipeptidase [Parahaliea mediterranea]
MTDKSLDKPGRRRLLSAAGGALLAAPMLNFGAFRVFAASDIRYSRRAVDLVASTQVIDMLSAPFPFGPMILSAMADEPKRMDGYAVSAEQLQVLLSSGIDVFHTAVGLGAEDAPYFVGRLNALVAEHPEHLRRIDSVADFDDLVKGERLGIIIGIQNADHFREPADVDRYYHLGQRISQLTYNSRNLIGTGATDRSDGGLSDFGVGIVERMNAVGMAVDVSHCGDRTTLDAFAVSKRPVLITHSNARALVDGHVRCKSDEAIRAVGRAGSVMGITGVRNFVRAQEPTTVEHVVDHIDYVARMIGIEHVGIGSDLDMDGYDDLPKPAYDQLKSGYSGRYAFRDKIDVDGFDHPKRTYDLVEAMIRRGYSDSDIRRVLSDNFRRVLGEVWQPA